MKINWLIPLSALLIIGCAPDLDSEVDAEDLENADAEDVGVAQDALSEVAGCHFYVGSNYGGTTKWFGRGTAINDLHAYSMGDKISSVRLRGGASTKMSIHKNHQGSSWYISTDVTTFHTSAWGNLGDNASSIDCY